MSLSRSLPQSRTANLANPAVGAAAVALCCLCLWTASHARSPFAVAFAAIVFALANGTLFSLMHEAVHGLFCDSRTGNLWAGRLCAAFFPTSFALQRAAHLTHHINNRSDAERFDYFGPDDNLGLKVAQWYSILTGLYWLMIPVFCIVYFFAAELFPLSRILALDENAARQTSAQAYAGSLDNVSASTFRLEVALAFAVQAALFVILQQTWVGWALCYGAFALFWSSIQYADHAFSPLDRVDGAWDLKVNRLLRVSQLNYFLHLAHHREPQLDWRRLPRKASAESNAIPYWRVLLVMWTGPRPLPGSHPTPARLARRNILVDVALCVIFGLIFEAIYTEGDYLYARAPRLYDLTTVVDDGLPMWRPFTIVYLTIMPLLLVAPFLFRTPRRLLPLGIAWTAELVVALAVYAAFPVKALSAPYDHSGVLGLLMDITKGINLHGNTFPSLHVTLSITAVWAYSEAVSRAGRVALWAWGVAIVASTMLLRQHGVADVAGGLALASATMIWLYPAIRRALATSEAVILGAASGAR